MSSVESAQSPAESSLTVELPLGGRGSDRAAALMWDWKRVRDDDGGARTRKLRNKGLLQSVVGLAIAGGMYALGHPILAAIVSTISTLTLLAALFSPGGVYAMLESGLGVFAAWVGRIVGWIVLLPIFVGFFVPFGLFFRRGARDPMKRRFEGGEPSYWKEREPDADVEERHLSQF